MAKRVSSTQLRQAVSRYNSKVRQLNSAIDRYNRGARAHNARVRANRRRLQSELRKLAHPHRTTVRLSYRYSVKTLHESFVLVEAAAGRPGSPVSVELLDLTEGETANSVAAYNALAEPVVDGEADDPSLRATDLTDELARIDPDLDSRWRGALFALNARNPDAARHFCTSARELLARIVDSSARDGEVLAANPSAELTADGSVSRRARIQHCLIRRGRFDSAIVDFVETDIDNVLALFGEFNQATHGPAGRFSISQLRALKARVEHAIQFLSAIVS